MTAAEIQTQVERVKRERVPFMLIRSFTWFQKLTPEKRYDVEERLGICIGNGPMTPEAFVIAREAAK